MKAVILLCVVGPAILGVWAGLASFFYQIPPGFH